MKKKVNQLLYFVSTLKIFKSKFFIIIVAILIFVPLSYTISRFISNEIYDYYLESKHFYFNSDKLDTNSPVYRVNNWSGSIDFPLDVEVNSRKNELEKSSIDINYTVSVDCDPTVTCTIANSSQRVLYASTNSDTFSINVHPLTTFDVGDVVNVDITAQSTAPYQKTITAKYLIEVAQEGISYEITDDVNQPYFILNVTNTFTTYTVNSAFGSYQVGDVINYEVYQNLPANQQVNCTSKLVNLLFNPNNILIDTTDQIVDNAVDTNSTTIGGYDYINDISFKMDAVSSKAIRFYKKDKSQDYTYPGSANSIVTFTVS